MRRTASAVACRNRVPEALLRMIGANACSRRAVSPPRGIRMPRTQPGRPATIGDVATAAGVSRATVSRVLNGRATVDGALVERVESAIAQLGYRPSETARNLSLGRTNTIALLVPDLGNPMFQAILHGLTLS